MHYKALRQILRIKIPYFHRIVSPTDSPCSNEFLLSLSYPVLPSCAPSSISDSRLKYLGYILRHPTSPESIMFKSSFSVRTISSPFRRGAPRAHWPELSLTKASHRSAPELKSFASSSMKQWYDTTRFMRVFCRWQKIGNNVYF